MSDFYSEPWHKMSRREFVKVTSAAAAGTMLMGWLPPKTEAVAKKVPHWGEVLMVRNDAATDGPNINADVVRVMMDESIKQFTNTSSVADAWASLLPDWKEDHVIAVKVNTISRSIATHPEVVAAIVAGLTGMGVPENNIIVYDAPIGSGLSACGYTYNNSAVGVRCFNPAFDWEHSVDILGRESALCSVVNECDHLINVPVPKDHNTAGVTLSLKNHLGSINSPGWFHTNFSSRCAALNALEAIRGKTRLIVMDALFGSSGSSTHWFPDFAPNSLIVSADPVAMDCTGTDMINEERVRRNQSPKVVPLLEEAVKMGLGAPAEEIRKVAMVMGTQVGVVCALSATAVPGILVAGRSTPLEVKVALDASRETSGSPRQMSVDLSSLGISSELPLRHAGGGRYTVSLTAPPLSNGQHSLPVMLETGGDERVCLTTAALDVYPDGDLSIYEEGPSTGWTIQVNQSESDPMSSKFVHSGSFSHAILSRPGQFAGRVTYMFDDPAEMDLFGYTHLEFWINGGEASGQDPRILGKKLSDFEVVPESDTWTLVSIPISELPKDREGGLASIWISGADQETFYIDDMKLVAMEPPEPETAVEVSEGRVVPSDYALSQNVPNPFNARTTIPYTLPKAGAVQLVIYNAAGQRIRKLVSGRQQAGSYGVIWDGKDGAGRNVASGVYLVRLAVEGKTVQTRRMTLVR